MKRKMMMAAALVMLTMSGAWAQGPNNSGTYYMNADGKSGAALKTAMYNIIKVKKHSPSYDELIDLYKYTDTRPDGSVRDWYSNITHFTHVTDKAGNYSKEGDVYNREHLVPQSWGPPKADIVHVVPTDGYVNNRRGNYPLGEVGNVTYQSANGYSKLGSCRTAGYSGTVFEPNDEVKGDIARIYFYMATCYQDQAKNWDGVFGGTTYQPMAQWAFDMMVWWSKLDPIDDVEIARNNAVYRSNVQGNRNPFVDYPGLEDYIWGDKVDVPFSYDNYDSSGFIAERVARPVFTPAGGTYADSVVVTITTATDSAYIYYTTNGVEPAENGILYEGPITLKNNTTLKAIAMKDSMLTSYQNTANYIITSGGGAPVEGTIALNNTLFGTSFTGTVIQMGTFTGTNGNITVSYSKGTGSNMYINSSQIRLYAGNTLTISSGSGNITRLEFTVVKNDKNKELQADNGTVNKYVWEGYSSSVTFTVNSGSGHIQLSHVKVSVAEENPTLEGDVTGDGVVDTKDIAEILHDIWNNALFGQGESKSDINKDGRLDVGDLIKAIWQMINITK